MDTIWTIWLGVCIAGAAIGFIVGRLRRLKDDEGIRDSHERID